MIRDSAIYEKYCHAHDMNGTSAKREANMYRVLIVEDDSIMQKTLRDSLKPEGYEVLLAVDGKTALRMAPQDKPDIILLDVHLPDIGGVEVCRALKADPVTKHIPILILTGQAREITARVAGLEGGADDYLFKPISPRVLVSRIRSILKINTGPT